MKNQTTIVIFLTAVFVFNAVSVNAQTRRLIKAAIPFDFTIGDETFSEGEYSIARLNRQKPSILVLQGIKNNKRIIFLTQKKVAKNAFKNPRLVFSKFGDSYFLSEIWTIGTKNGRKLINKQLEKNSEQDTGLKTETVILSINGKN